MTGKVIRRTGGLEVIGHRFATYSVGRGGIPVSHKNAQQNHSQLTATDHN
jgi:hypothetical protein